MIHPTEQGLVEQLVARPAVKAPDVALLHRLARRNIALLNADLPAPGEHGIGRELRVIVTDDCAGLTALRDEIGPFLHEPAARDRDIRHSPQALTGHVIDHVLHPKPSRGRKLIVDEGQSSELVGQCQTLG